MSAALGILANYDYLLLAGWSVENILAVEAGLRLLKPPAGETEIQAELHRTRGELHAVVAQLQALIQERERLAAAEKLAAQWRGVTAEVAQLTALAARCRRWIPGRTGAASRQRIRAARELQQALQQQMERLGLQKVSDLAWQQANWRIDQPMLAGLESRGAELTQQLATLERAAAAYEYEAMRTQSEEEA